METIVVDDSGVTVFGDDLDKPDAQDAREDELLAKAKRLLAKAKRLRTIAKRLLAEAKAAEDAATECLPQLDMKEDELDTRWGPDPDPMVLLFSKGHGYALDPVELALCGVRDFDDVEILEQYVGSSADVTELIRRK